ncbi:hypothetical protein L083_1742 [Actinoplanes sp. N902-109]|nr:hypothetical protein L083_1742 [Actinoplanes sp. N902-109]
MSPQRDPDLYPGPPYHRAAPNCTDPPPTYARSHRATGGTKNRAPDGKGFRPAPGGVHA